MQKNKKLAIFLDDERVPKFANIIGVKSLPYFYAENISKLTNSYQKEIDSSRFLSLNLDKNRLDLVFKLVRVSLAELDFTKCAVEITSDAKVKCSLLFPEEKMLMVTKPIYPVDYELNDNQVFFSFFINRKLIVSNVFEVQKLVDRFNVFFSL